MNDPTDVLADRVPVPADLRPLGKLAGLLDDPVGGPPSAPGRPPAADPPKPPAEPQAADPAPAVPAPKPRWVREAVGDLLRWNRQKAVVLSAAGSLVAGALALNALFGGAGRGPTDAPKGAEPPSVA